ncbi:MAG: VWA domain-containing protein [Gemmatimonadota bacterium]
MRRTRRSFPAWSALLGVAFLTGCSSTPPGTGVFLLLDTSGTYSQELEGARTVVNYLLGTLDPGDSFGVARIDSGSFSEKDILLRMTFDERPSVANDQKRVAMQTVQSFADTVATASHTDITGGVLQAVEWLNEVGPGRKTVLIFSDLEEDLPEGFIRDFPIQLDGVEVIAINVTKLQPDNVDPRAYMARLDDWKQRVESGGGQWAVVNDMERLPVALEL